MDRIERHGTRPPAPHDHNGRAPTRHPLDDASIGDLFRQLTSDASHLVQQEMHLAKAELKESVARVRTMVVGFAVAAALAIPGALALTAFLVIGVGALIGSAWTALMLPLIVQRSYSAGEQCPSSKTARSACREPSRPWPKMPPGARKNYARSSAK